MSLLFYSYASVQQKDAERMLDQKYMDFDGEVTYTKVFEIHSHPNEMLELPCEGSRGNSSSPSVSFFLQPIDALCPTVLLLSPYYPLQT